jgi:hypothetical protein
LRQTIHCWTHPVPQDQRGETARELPLRVHMSISRITEAIHDTKRWRDWVAMPRSDSTDHNHEYRTGPLLCSATTHSWFVNGNHQ